MIDLIVLAKPLTLLVLKDQWLPMVPMLQILCIDWMFDHLNLINLNVLYVKGRSDIAFKNEIIKKILAIIIFFVSLYWGIFGVCWGRVLYGCIAIYINSYYTKRLIGLSIMAQVRDIIKPLLYAIYMGIIVYLITLLKIDLIYIVFIGILASFGSYFFIIFYNNPKLTSEVRTLVSKFK